jgi:hypothetical protein
MPSASIAIRYGKPAVSPELTPDDTALTFICKGGGPINTKRVASDLGSPPFFHFFHLPFAVSDALPSPL